MIGCFQKAEGCMDNGSLSLTIMGETEWPSHRVWGQQNAWRFNQLGVSLKGLDIDAHGGNADGFDGPCEVTDGYMAQGSARS